MLDDSTYGLFQSAQSSVMQADQAYAAASSSLSLSDQAFVLAGLVGFDDESQANSIQAGSGIELSTLSEKTEQNWQLYDLQWEASPESQAADPTQFIGVVGDGLIGLTVTFAEEGWKGLLGIAESAGAEAVEGVEAAEAAGAASEAIDILVVAVLL